MKHIPTKYKTGGLQKVVNKWTQPYADAAGTARSKPNYDKTAALEDAKDLSDAIRDKRERKIVEISGRRAHWQRKMIKMAFINVSVGKIRDLVKELKDVLGGKLESTLVPLYEDAGVYDAYWMKEAMEGMGCDCELLCEILCTRLSLPCIFMFCVA